MGLDHRRLMSWPFKDVVHRYEDKDTMLYALSLGLGSDPTDVRQLQFVYEQGLKAFPTMPIVLGMTDLGFLADRDVGIDLSKMLHGESGLLIHSQLPPRGAVISRMRLVDLVDKGAQKGALLYFERRIRDAADDRPLATERGCFVLRGNGGFSSEIGASAPPRMMPNRPADRFCELRSLPQSALLYRLSGDRNPLHVDPAIARTGGFERPILHGSCTYGIAGHALLQILCDHDPSRLLRMEVRFTAPVLPGETIRTEVWMDTARSAQFRCSVIERNRVVLDNGYAEFANAPVVETALAMPVSH
ncbi:MaoC/PaaZ C-terminal domain-containing protein [Bradyrhizobium sp. LTSPM299]|uniref:MaoC/PaaZ C-terminal domain-containing protein n=1 Tax=Bradyrhizobium sp. LTSPM299 TaxID=1619233 RepID=UPI0005C83F46|nr:MaoC/PaaZ C-terminal domain-containing protein [Bradyrhizobium sp. LTSPM299]